MNAKTKENFRNKLTNYNWDSVYNEEEPGEAYKYFFDASKEIFNNSFPIKKLSRNQAKLYSKPWITKGLLKSIKTKCNLYKKFLSHPSPLNDANYKKYKNKLNHQIKISKRNYHDKRFENAKGNLKETWKILNEVINKRETRSKMPSLFVYKDKQITDPLDTANRFCEYFTNVGLSLANKLPESGISHDSYSETFFLIQLQ